MFIWEYAGDLSSGFRYYLFTDFFEIYTGLLSVRGEWKVLNLDPPAMEFPAWSDYN